MSKSVLLVDDDDDIRETLGKYLTREGFQVVLARNPDEARGRIQFQSFDILLVDVNMPGQNGIQFLAKLRQNPPKPWPKVVVMSGLEIEEEARMKLLSVIGIDQMLQKPIDPAQLMDLLKNKLFQPPEKRTYDASIINAFLNGTINAIQANTAKLPERENPFVKEAALTYGEFTGVIQFHGKTMKGVVALSFEKGCVEALAKAVFQNAEMELSDQLLMDFSGEICNQVAGQTQSIFEKAGSRIEITTPTLIHGRSTRIVHKIQAPCLILPFRWGGGRFFTEFVLEKVSENEARTVEEETKKPVADSGDITFF